MNDPRTNLQRGPTVGGRLSAVTGSVTDADLVHAARAGDRRAFSTLFERWFDRSYDVAWRIVRNRDTAAEVAQDTFLVAWQKLDTLRDADAFGGWILRTARNRALNRLEREGRSLAFDTDDTVTMVDRDRSAVDVADQIVRQEQHDLVWAAAAALGERDASILDLHLRHDLDPAQIAEALDITPNAAHQTLFRLRKRLEGAIRSYVLWHDGAPECGELAEVLEQEGVGGFGPTAVKVISRHVTECAVCDERQSSVLAPASMFAAVPLVVVGLDVRRAAAAELASHGVPIDPDLVGGGAAGDPPTPSPSGTGEESRGLWQINLGSTRRRVAMGSIAALFLLVAAVVGMGLLEGDGPTDVDLVAAPGTTNATTAPPSTSGTTATSASPSAPDTTATDTSLDDLAEPVDPAGEPAPSDPPVVVAPPDTTVTVPDPVPTPPSEPDPETTTSSTSSTTTEPPPTAPPPVIVRFTAVDTGQPCSRLQPLSRRYRLIWLTRDAETVHLGGTLAAPPGPHPVSGEAEGCLPPRSSGVWMLEASSSGGTVTAIVEVP